MAAEDREGDEVDDLAEGEGDLMAGLSAIDSRDFSRLSGVAAAAGCGGDGSGRPLFANGEVAAAAEAEDGDGRSIDLRTLFFSSVQTAGRRDVSRFERSRLGQPGSTSVSAVSSEVMESPSTASRTLLTSSTKTRPPCSSSGPWQSSLIWPSSTRYLPGHCSL